MLLNGKKTLSYFTLYQFLINTCGLVTFFIIIKKINMCVYILTAYFFCCKIKILIECNFTMIIKKKSKLF